MCIWYIRYHLKGIKAGHAEVFVENLPCLPDNIRRSSTGGYWIACGFTRYDGKFNLLDFTAQRPWIRWIISKVSKSFPHKEICPSYMFCKLQISKVPCVNSKIWEYLLHKLYLLFSS